MPVEFVDFRIPQYDIDVDVVMESWVTDFCQLEGGVKWGGYTFFFGSGKEKVSVVGMRNPRAEYRIKFGFVTFTDEQMSSGIAWIYLPAMDETVGVVSRIIIVILKHY